MSGYPAYGGTVELNNSKLTLSSNGSSFPYITTAVNPFASGEDFVVEFDFTYKGISDFGNGLWITDGQPSIFYNDPAKETATKKIFSLWADNNQSYTRTRISITLLGQEVWTTYIQGWEPNAPTYTFKLVYTGNIYTVFIDGVEVASAQSELYPNSISFGHPPAIYVPFSATHLQTLLGRWTSFVIDYITISQPVTSTPSPTSTLTISPTPSVNPTASAHIPSKLDFTCKSANSNSYFKIEINGKLSAQNNDAIPNEGILLSYSVTGGSSWNELAFADTDNDGVFSVVWLPSASGNYLINATWMGNSIYSRASEVANLVIAPYLENSVFAVSSNSTLSGVSFDSAKKELRFSVTGPTGTTGQVNINIPKSLIADISTLKAYLDGNQLTFTAESTSNAWIIYFTYHHSTHSVTLNLDAEQIDKSIQATQTNTAIYAIPLAIIIVAIATFLALRKK